MNKELKPKRSIKKKKAEKVKKTNKLAKTLNKAKTILRHTYLINAGDQKIGRMSTIISKYLRGKNKPEFTYNQDFGDTVIVINSAKIKVNARKAVNKKFYRHSGYVKGLKEENMAEILEKYPNKLIYMAVKGMLPRNKISKQQLKRLKIYEDEFHKHKAQKIIEININEEK